MKSHDEPVAPQKRLSWRCLSGVRGLPGVVGGAGAAVLVASLLPEQPVQDKLISGMALLPGLSALLVAVVTRRVLVALLVGVVLGSAVQVTEASGLVTTSGRYLLGNLQSAWHLQIMGFATAVLALVRLVEASGGTAGMVGLLVKRVQSAKSAMLATSAMGLLIFFDDYANSMIVGGSMRRVVDRFGVSRAKLAYLVDSTSAPVAGLAVISTWIAYEVGVLEEALSEAGVALDGYAVLVQALPYRFYCVFALALVFLSSAMGRDIGPMRRSRARGDITERLSEPVLSTVRWTNAAVPIAVLILGIIGGLTWAGGGGAQLLEQPLSAFTLHFWTNTLGAVESTERVLLIAALAALAIGIVLAVSSKALTTLEALKAAAAGARMAGVPLCILVCAWGLSAVSKDVAAAGYIGAALQGVVSPGLLPAAAFVVASVVALATGTSWGTMALLIPATVPLAAELAGVEGSELMQASFVLPTISAILDGAIFGDHCSPVSDTTVLSSTATECDVLEHVWTQLPYALAAMLVGLLGYLAAPHLGTWGVPLPVLYVTGAAVLWTLLRVFGSPPQQLPSVSEP